MKLVILLFLVSYVALCWSHKSGSGSGGGSAGNGDRHQNQNGKGHTSHGNGNGYGHNDDHHSGGSSESFTSSSSSSASSEVPCVPEGARPNIVMFVADDFGWNDIGMDDVTPNINRMATEGLQFDNSYVLPVGSMTRSSLLTGYYPHRLGLQHLGLFPSDGHGIPTDFTLLPEKLQALCYDTYAVGKWNLGFCADEYLPGNRGFDSFFGTYTSGVDYFDKTSRDPFTDDSAYDLHRDSRIVPEDGEYISDKFVRRALRNIDRHNIDNPLYMYYAFQLPHSPLQVPQDKLDQFYHVNPERHTFLAMASVMDDAVQSVVDALTEKGMLDNTLIIFVSDNGGEVSQGGNNSPLRGNKGTLYDGAMRTPAFMWGSMVSTGGQVATGFMHAVDWFPTILSIAGGLNEDFNMDGLDQSIVLQDVSIHVRQEFLYALDDTLDMAAKAAYRWNDYKLIDGEASFLYPIRTDDDTGGWYPEPADANSPDVQNYVIIENPGEVPQPQPGPSVPQTLLFNMNSDPYEENNIADDGIGPIYVEIIRSKIFMERLRALSALGDNGVDADQYDNMVADGAWDSGWCQPVHLAP